jgi:hypothetical protein
MEEKLARKTSAEWWILNQKAFLADHHTIDQVFRDEQVLHQQMLMEVELPPGKDKQIVPVKRREPGSYLVPLGSGRAQPRNSADSYSMSFDDLKSGELSADQGSLFFQSHDRKRGVRMEPCLKN